MRRAQNRRLPPNAGKGPLPGDKYHASRASLASQGTFCARCGAWRGSLGLEPTYQLYVDHVVEVLREVRRVLRPDGTLWLVIGDCYATGGGKAKRAVQHALDLFAKSLSGLGDDALIDTYHQAWEDHRAASAEGSDNLIKSYAESLATEKAMRDRFPDYQSRYQLRYP
jgi:SAM-dependent methyltransferase